MTDKFKELKLAYEKAAMALSSMPAISPESEMKEKFYLFQFGDDSTYEMTCGISFKDALWEMSKYTGHSSELLLKSLRGFEENDIDEMIDLFERLNEGTRIQNVYIVEKKIYDQDKRERKE